MKKLHKFGSALLYAAISQLYLLMRIETHDVLWDVVWYIGFAACAIYYFLQMLED